MNRHRWRPTRETAGPGRGDQSARGRWNHPIGSRRIIRRGVSLLDVLVVIGVVVVLTVLALPGLLRMRENARRTRCDMNLARIGQAIGVYTGKHGAPPPGLITGPDLRFAAAEGAGKGTLSSISGLALLVPALDSLPEHGPRATEPVTVRASFASLHPVNRTAAERVVAEFICPANDEPFRFDDPFSGFRLARTDYALSHGAHAGLDSTGAARFDPAGTSWPARGPFGINRSFSPKDCGNALSSFIVLAETASGYPSRTAGGQVRQAWIAGCIPGTAGEVGGGTPLFASAADALVSWADTDEEMLRLQPGYRPLLPNGGACGTTPPARVDQSWGSTSSAPGAAADVAARIRTGAMSLPGIRSRHAGGANALMADGSARFLSNDIEAEVLVRLTILLPDRHPTARPVAQPAAGGAFAR